MIIKSWHVSVIVLLVLVRRHPQFDEKVIRVPQHSGPDIGKVASLLRDLRRLQVTEDDFTAFFASSRGKCKHITSLAL